VKRFFSNLFQEKNAVTIISVISAILLIIPFIFFLWKRVFFDWSQPVDASMLGTLGDFVGGVLGSIWALVGIILFYLALREQRKDIAMNQIALSKQIEALEIQTNEFKLQKEELAQSRNVFIEQSKTLKKQQFETTFFAMIQMYGDNLKILNSKTTGGKDFFISFIDELKNMTNADGTALANHQEVISNYNELFFKYKNDISHYFKIVYRIVKFIDSGTMNDTDKRYYSKVLRSQFAENELLMLYYNSYTIFGTKFYPLILKYNLLKHLPSDSKVEFKMLVMNNAKFDLNRLLFIQEITSYLKNYIKEFKTLNESEYTEFTPPLNRSLMLNNQSMIIAIKSDDLIEVELSFISINNEKLKEIYKLEIKEFMNYVLHHLNQKFIFSKYIEYEVLNFSIVEKLDSNNVYFTIKSNKEISV
tara:strand:- start:2015 stop:3268 length:1254 start_codon:yes stop_codon:yes gene_type:complete